MKIAIFSARLNSKIKERPVTDVDRPPENLEESQLISSLGLEPPATDNVVILFETGGQLVERLSRADWCAQWPHSASLVVLDGPLGYAHVSRSETIAANDDLLVNVGRQKAPGMRSLHFW